MIHNPVLSKEIVEALDPKPGQHFIDCTVGQGGHAKLILEKTAPQGKVLGIDWDKRQIENCKNILNDVGNRLILINDSYSNLEAIVKRIGFSEISGILIDLGYSSWHLEDSGRGFTFQKNENLDMRYDQIQNSLSAEVVINEWSEKELAKIFLQYGEERFAKKIAKKIAEQRKAQRIKTTFELAEVVKEAVPSFYWRGKIHYATKTFQALRIAVNGELENVEKVLPQAFSLLKSKGKLAVISFHSLEDRIVKNIFRDFQSQHLANVMYKKPIVANQEELRHNPRARSAKLRVLIKKST